jgi:hypothetical protein
MYIIGYSSRFFIDCSWRIFCNYRLGTVRPDWICMRVVSLKSPSKGHQPLYVYNFFIFYLEFLKQLQSYEPLHAKRPLILLLVRLTVCMCSSRDLFRQTVFHKSGRGINCSWDCGSQVKNFIIPQPKPKQSCTLADFFHQMKCASQ